MYGTIQAFNTANKARDDRLRRDLWVIVELHRIVSIAMKSDDLQDIEYATFDNILLSLGKAWERNMIERLVDEKLSGGSISARSRCDRTSKDVMNENGEQIFDEDALHDRTASSVQARRQIVVEEAHASEADELDFEPAFRNLLKLLSRNVSFCTIAFVPTSTHGLCLPATSNSSLHDLQLAAPDRCHPSKH